MFIKTRTYSQSFLECSYFLGSGHSNYSRCGQAAKTEDRASNPGSGSGSLKIRCNNPKVFLTTCNEIASTLETRLRSEIEKREEEKIWDVRMLYNQMENCL